MKERDATQTYSVKSSYDNYFDRSQGIQILVATDGNSASASELLLGAMLDYNTCVHIGETSFGKGIAQYIEPILKGTFERDGKTYTSYYGIYYTAAYYYTPNGINIHHIGFTPDEQYRAYDYENIMDITLNYFGN
jgi:carboxyl-terminal processing protease